MSELADYGERLHVAIKNYLENRFNYKLSPEDAKKLTKRFSVSDVIKISDAIQDNNIRVVRNMMLDKLDIQVEGYGINRDGAGQTAQRAQNAKATNANKRGAPNPPGAAVRDQRRSQPTGQGARLNVPNQQAQNTMTTQQNQQMAKANNAKADQNRADIEQLKRMAGVR